MLASDGQPDHAVRHAVPATVLYISTTHQALRACKILCCNANIATAFSDQSNSAAPPSTSTLTTDHHSSPDSKLLHAIPPAIALFQGKPLLQPDKAVELVKAGQQLELVLVQLTLLQELPVHCQ